MCVCVCVCVSAWVDFRASSMTSASSIKLTVTTMRQKTSRFPFKGDPSAWSVPQSSINWLSSCLPFCFSDGGGVVGRCFCQQEVVRLHCLSELFCLGLARLWKINDRPGRVSVFCSWQSSKQCNAFRGSTQEVVW